MIGAQVFLRVFYTGLVFMARFKETTKCKYKRMARVQYRLLQRWADNGAVSCIHMHQLLHAEVLSTSTASQTDNVSKEYDRAIESAASLGFRNHVALANELAGMYLHDEPPKAALYLSRAIDAYREWGAEAKVQDLHGRHGDLLLTTTDA